MSPDPGADREAADGYLQRAQLLAELGRYDEAASELGYAIVLESDNVPALTMLAQVHLAADRPAEALTAADSAVAAAPEVVYPLVARGMALADLRRFREAAQVADEILALGPTDPYAQRSAAAILAESRNGQQALNAAWRGVELDPAESRAHLVLGLVAARLELFDLAEQAYREALRLDPALSDARHNLGVIRLEQRRYADALEHLTEAAALRPETGEASATIANAVRQWVLYGAGYLLVATVLVACLAAGAPGGSRLLAGLAVVTGAVLAWRFAARIPNFTGTVLPNLMRADRTLALAVYAIAVAPALLLLYTLVGTPWPLALAIAVTAVAELAVVLRRIR